jgi:putative PIN family toxin of toxin-antitoxin system
MRVVLDTGVLVAALRSATGASRKLLIAAMDRTFEMVITAPLLLEYEAVLKRPEHLDAAGATSSDVDVILDQIAATARCVKVHYLWRPCLKDADDDLVLEAAVNGEADIVATFNLKDFRPAMDRFAVRFLRPAELWTIVR